MYKLVTLFLILILFSGCSQPTVVHQSDIFLDTIVEISVADRHQSRQLISQVIKQAFAEIARIDGLLSRFNPESEISRINSQGHVQPTKVSAETISLLEQSIRFSQLSDGAFDITITPLLELWNTAENRQQLPTSEEIKQVLEQVGYQNIEISKASQTVFLTQEGMSLDLGGIAKGYAVDRAVAVLEEQGIVHALVNAGGDIYCLGWRNQPQGWQIAVQHPRQQNAQLATLELNNQAVATSGDYRKYIQINGERFSQIIDPKTGYPRQDAPASVTVLAESCLAADALATSIFVLGPEKGIDLANRLENIEALVAGLSADKLNIFVSLGLEEKLNSVNE